MNTLSQYGIEGIVAAMLLQMTLILVVVNTLYDSTILFEDETAVRELAANNDLKFRTITMWPVLVTQSISLITMTYTLCSIAYTVSHGRAVLVAPQNDYVQPMPDNMPNMREEYA